MVIDYICIDVCDIYGSIHIWGNFESDKMLELRIGIIIHDQ